MLGYSITSEVDIKQFWLWHGPKANNGKSTCYKLIKSVFSNLITTLDSDIITQTKGDAVKLANFQTLGKRLGVINELPEGLEIGESNTKILTGCGDDIIAKELYRDTFSFRPIIKMHILSNYPLIINTDQPAMCNRLSIIPFNVVFSDTPKEDEIKIDYKFIERLETKYNRIL